MSTMSMANLRATQIVATLQEKVEQKVVIDGAGKGTHAETRYDVYVGAKRVGCQIVTPRPLGEADAENLDVSIVGGKQLHIEA